MTLTSEGVAAGGEAAAAQTKAEKARGVQAESLCM